MSAKAVVQQRTSYHIYYRTAELTDDFRSIHIHCTCTCIVLDMSHVVQTSNFPQVKTIKK